MSRRARVVSVFTDLPSFVRALKSLQAAGQRDIAVYSPVGLTGLEPFLPTRSSPIRFLTLAGAIAGGIGGFWMCLGSAALYNQIVGAKLPHAVLPYCVVGFELTVLIGGLTALTAMLLLARLRPWRRPPDYDPRYGEDLFGLTVWCSPAEAANTVSLLRDGGAREVQEQGESRDQ